MIESLAFLLLPLAAASGWWACLRWLRRQRRDRIRFRESRYFEGLNYLLREQPDKALEYFQQIASDELPSLELQLALGSLFRRRGEIDKAVTIHQSLLSLEGLTSHQRNQITAQLGEDYMSAGLLDRAERLFVQCLDQGASNLTALEQLLRIYQQEQEWEKAIAIARTLQGRHGQNRALELGQFHCELAEQALAGDQPERAGQWLELALQSDPECARANCLRGRLRCEHGDYRRAIAAYLSALNQSPDMALIIVPELAAQYRELSDPSGLLRQLEALHARNPSIALTLALVDAMQLLHGSSKAEQWLLSQLQQHPSLAGLRRLFSLAPDMQQPLSGEVMELAASVLAQFEQARPAFCCRHCGFSSRTHEWRCPSCLNWNSLRPIEDVAGE